MKNSPKGITLIALVITIIVLLILAGVSVSMVAGDNGVLNQASKAKLETEIATEKEMVGLAYSALKADVLAGNTVKIDAESLEQEINKQYNSEMVTVTEGESTLIVKFNDSGREYILDNEGGFLDTLPIEDVLATAEKHPDQTLTNDIGIAEDGTLVNLDLWNYTLISDNTYNLGAGGYYSGYDNNKIVDGKIQGKIPMYIKEDGQEFHNVSYVTFSGCTNLIIAPKMPSGITDMSNTFYECTNLVEVPEISNTVTDMSCAFYKCSSLTNVCKIPDSVIDMRQTFNYCTSLAVAPEFPNYIEALNFTFDGCTNLKEVPEIPSSVISMNNTFYNCTNLTGILKINASPTYYSNCFENASTAEGTSLVLVGNGENDETITNLYNTKSENSNITIGSGT